MKLSPAQFARIASETKLHEKFEQRVEEQVRCFPTYMPIDQIKEIFRQRLWEDMTNLAVNGILPPER